MRQNSINSQPNNREMMASKHTIILFYKFTDIKNPEQVKLQQRKIAEAFDLKGRMLIGKEGINATFEGTTQNIKAYVKKQKQSKLLKGVVFKESEGNGKGFTKLKIKVREEIVTLGAGTFNIKKETAKVVTATALEKMYEKDEDFAVLDLRNNYEVEAGFFEKTVNPNLKNFRELPQKIAELKHLKNKKIITVCTGGIRCEKATCLLKREGFTNLYQLKDGIHTYIKKYPGKRFKGSLFVFDNRMITPVVETEDRQVVGKCKYCNITCEEFYNDDSIRPSRKVICCDECILTKGKKLRKCIPA